MQIDPATLAQSKTAQTARPAERVRVEDGEAEKPARKPHTPPEATMEVARQIEAYLRSQNRSLEFRVDADTGRTVVSVRDSETGELIRQIPGEEVLRIAQSMKELAALLDTTV